MNGRVVKESGAGLLVLFLLGAGVATSADQPPVVKNDIVYQTVDGKPLKLDAYLPGSPGPHPAVILIHGGAWREGDKSGYKGWGTSYAEKGIAAFSINYRLSREATYPAAVEDCVSAVRWVRSQATEYKVDPDRVGVEGGSAGGHLALMVALMEPDKGETDSQGRPLRNLVRCVISHYGPTDLADAVSVKLSVDKVNLTRFLGGTCENMPERYRAASPVTYVSADDPAVLLLHGTADAVVPHVQSVILQQRLRKAGVPVELVSVKGAGHGLSGMSRDERIALRERAEAFMITHLRNK